MFFIHGYLASGDDWYVNDLKNSLVDKVKPLLISDNAKLREHILYVAQQRNRFWHLNQTSIRCKK